MTDAASNPRLFEVQEKLQRLEEALNEQAPGLPSLLRDIHRQLKKDEAVVTLLSEEECNILVEGLKRQTKVEIATAAVKSPKKKALSKMTVADL